MWVEFVGSWLREFVSQVFLSRENPGFLFIFLDLL